MAHPMDCRRLPFRREVAWSWAFVSSIHVCRTSPRGSVRRRMTQKELNVEDLSHSFCRRGAPWLPMALAELKSPQQLPIKERLWIESGNG